MIRCRLRRWRLTSMKISTRRARRFGRSATAARAAARDLRDAIAPARGRKKPADHGVRDVQYSRLKAPPVREREDDRHGKNP
jgi:hypothetical protein